MTNVQHYVRGGRKLHNMSGYRCLHLPHNASGDVFQPTGLIVFALKIYLFARISGGRAGVNVGVRYFDSKCCMKVLRVVQLLSYISSVYRHPICPSRVNNCIPQLLSL